MASSSASAESVGSSTLSVRVKDVIAIRILDDTGTSSISTLGIDIAPTPNGSTVTKNAIVDVATSNETGYTLYMDSDYKEDGTSSSTTPETQFNYTTDLIHTDPTVTVTIPSSVPSSSSDTNFWNYTTSWNDTIGTGSNTTTLTGSTPATVIPTHGTPDTIRDDVTEPSDSSMTTIGINVNVNNDIPSGTYKNKLVFTAVANELPPAIPAFWTITTMQEMTPEVCASVYTPGNVTGNAAIIVDETGYANGDYDNASDGGPYVAQRFLRDVRDDSGYTIRKLADGNCWMTSSLALGSGTQTFTINSETSDYSGEPFTLPLAQTSAGQNWNAQTTAATTNVFNIYKKDAWTVYYNWYTATAKSGTFNMTSGDAPYSICPKGWHLPKGNDTTGEGRRVWDLYSGNVFTTPVGATNTGLYTNGSIATQYYLPWSGTALADVKAYTINYTTADYGGYGPTTDTNKARGHQIRCVANQKTLWDINIMQEMTPEICAAATTPASSATTTDANGSHIGDASYVPQNTLTDTRDSNSYTVRKLADGNCWMVSNLRLGAYGQSIDLTPADSDILTNYTVDSADIINSAGQNWNSTPDQTHIFDRNNTTYGNWYNWYTATAGTGTSSIISADAPSSICPKGWKLPDSTGNKSYQNLASTYGATNLAKIQAEPLIFNPAGLYWNGATDWINQSGYYWTASSNDASNAYRFDFYSSEVRPRYAANKASGYNIRCILR